MTHPEISLFLSKFPLPDGVEVADSGDHLEPTSIQHLTAAREHGEKLNVWLAAKGESAEIIEHMGKELFNILQYIGVDEAQAVDFAVKGETPSGVVIRHLDSLKGTVQ